MSYIIWRGVDSRDIPGLMISTLPPITKPAMRFEETVIDGRDGALVEPLGFEAYSKEMEIGLRGDYDIDEVAAYFTGSGSLILSNEEEREYNAAIFEAVDFQRLLRFRTATVKFYVQPYKHLAGERARAITASPARVTNNGTAPALPWIHLEGSGTVSVKVNGDEIFRYAFDDAGAVDIDAEAEEASLGAVLKNRNMTGDFPSLKIGTNTIEYTGNIKKFEIKTNTRFI